MPYRMNVAIMAVALILAAALPATAAEEPEREIEVRGIWSGWLMPLVESAAHWIETEVRWTSAWLKDNSSDPGKLAPKAQGELPDPREGTPPSSTQTNEILGTPDPIG